MQPENTQQSETVQTPQPVPTPITAPVAKPIKVVKRAPRQRHFLAAFFISFMWGAFGVDRMYMGYWGLGILKLITLGGFGIWVIVDLILILGGYMRDKQGREMLQAAEYKKFAYRTILIFAISLGLIVLINGILLISGVTQLFTMLQDGNIPGLESLNGAQGSNGLPTDLQQELGL